MILLVVVGLIAGAVSMLLISPRVLAQGTWQVRRPALALALWHTAFVCGAALLVASVLVSVTAATGFWMPAAEARSVPIPLVGWLALIVLAGIIVIVSANAEAVGEADQHNRSAVLAITHRQVFVGDVPVLRCELDEPVAFALPGRDGIVVISTGMAALLEPAQLRAVVAHESAHLRRHHHLAVRLADLHIACMPRTAAARGLRRSTNLSIELIADDAAAREAGAVHLANALVRIGATTHDEAMLMRAQRIATRTWRPRRGGTQVRDALPVR